MQKRTFLLFLVILFTITVKGQNTAKDILINTSLTIGNYVVKALPLNRWGLINCLSNNDFVHILIKTNKNEKNF